jgi:hypothetical protein
MHRDGLGGGGQKPGGNARDSGQQAKEAVHLLQLDHEHFQNHKDHDFLLASTQVFTTLPQRRLERR